MADLTPSAGFLWKLLADLVAGYSACNEKFFEHHIEPLQSRVHAVHQDYLTAFAALSDHLRDSSKPSIELIEFLAERRRDYDAERHLSRAVAREVYKLRKLGLPGDTRKAIESYCRAIVAYFYASSLVGHSSWFTHFILMVRQHIVEGRAQVWEPLFIAGSPRLFVLEEVDAVLAKRLPRAFNRVSDSYATLRARML